ncbi:hypothetical protein L3Q82_003636 [Scortum barcoo]|uniref:Uncharacterized protein n=1 Tax=Scortum barcoo TaxID=214431 RepID=A0ACB8VN98_9TELE|nr:hypothetical protein L3Q82_003636 [Scortum barcoo]
MSLGWPGNASGSPGRAGGSVWGEGSLGISAQTAASMTQVPDQADEEDEELPQTLNAAMHHCRCTPTGGSDSRRGKGGQEGCDKEVKKDGDNGLHTYNKKVMKKIDSGSSRFYFIGYEEDSSSESGSGNGLPALTPPSSAVTDGAIVREMEVVNGNGVPAPLDFSTPTSSSSSSEDQQPMNLSDPPPQRLPLPTSHLPVTVSAAALRRCSARCTLMRHEAQELRRGKYPLSPQYSSGGSYDSVKMDLSAEDLTMGRHGSQVAPDDDDDDHDDHDDNDKINDTEGVDPERLKAFNMFVRLFVDENLDRMVPISKQPKEKIQAIIESCSRQFPEFQERARKRIRTYLKSCRRMKKNGMETRPTPPHLTSAMAENILAAACENESRNAAKRMRLEAYHDEQISLDKPSSGGGGLREPASLAHSAYSLAASAFSSQDTQLYINGAGLSYGYRGYPGLSAAMQHPVSLTTGAAAAQSNGPTDLSMKSLSSANISNSSSVASANNSLGGRGSGGLEEEGAGASTQLSQPEITAVRQLIAGYRESAAFLLRSADELENLILQQN